MTRILKNIKYGKHMDDSDWPKCFKLTVHMACSIKSQGIVSFAHRTRNLEQEPNCLNET